MGKSKESALVLEDLAKNLDAPFKGNDMKAAIRSFGDFVIFGYSFLSN
jgi:hypothetical protein